MYTPSDSQATALLAHVVSQVQQNVEFLVSQNYISDADASAFLSKLPNSNSNAGINQLAPQVQVMPTNDIVPPLRRGVPPPHPSLRTIQARALWAYNENGQVNISSCIFFLPIPAHANLSSKDADDLSFSAGDIIEIVAETNDAWWMGKVNGKQALFPSNYVEKIDASTTGSTPTPPDYNPAGSSFAPSQTNEKPMYRPFGAAHHGKDTPPANGEVNSIGLQQDPGQAQKKGKYGKFGNTVCLISSILYLRVESLMQCLLDDRWRIQLQEVLVLVQVHSHFIPLFLSAWC
jgi:hypothetical protein